MKSKLAERLVRTSKTKNGGSIIFTISSLFSSFSLGSGLGSFKITTKQRRQIAPKYPKLRNVENRGKWITLKVQIQPSSKIQLFNIDIQTHLTYCQCL